MAPVIALLVIATISFLVIRTGATALEHTGLSRDAARFQALSAFFGAGFTTGESELVVNHPVRRRVIRDLIIVGNIGVISLLTSGVATATTDYDGLGLWARIVIIVGGLALLALLTKSRLAMRVIDWTIERTLETAGVVAAMDYEKVLRTSEGYGVAEIGVDRESRLAGRTLQETRPRTAGVAVLAIARDDGSYTVSPKGDARVEAGDTLLVYGADEDVRRLAERRSETAEESG